MEAELLSARSGFDLSVNVNDRGARTNPPNPTRRQKRDLPSK